MIAKLLWPCLHIHLLVIKMRCDQTVNLTNNRVVWLYNVQNRLTILMEISLPL